MDAQSGELTATYKIVPPPSTVAPPSLSQETIHKFPIISLPGLESKEDTDSLKRYYTSLRASIAEARTKLGQELTAWRDAVGNAELGKEKSVKAEADDEGEEEENAEE
jgi:hypothetical protein